MTKRKVIALDLDDVLAVNAPSFIEFSNRQWGGKLSPGDFQEDFQAMWGVDIQEVNRRMAEFADLGIVADYPHFEDAVPVIRALSNRFKLIVVTSRRKVLADHTLVWLERYFGGVLAEVHHTGIFDNLQDGSHRITKLDLCRNLGVDYLVDDQLKHCFAVAEAGIETVLFGSYSWNQAAVLPPRVHRAANWQAVKGYFDGRR